VTESLVERPTVEGGCAIADPGRDLAKIAVVERHLATGRVGVGFVRGSGLQRGALASTVAHDAHNLVVLGVSDDDMLAAVARAAELGGGIVAVEGARCWQNARSLSPALLRRAARRRDRAEPRVHRRRRRSAGAARRRS